MLIPLLLSFVIHRMAKWKELPNFNISILFGNVSHLFLFSDSEVLESFEIKYTWSKSFRGNFSTFVSIYCGRSRFLISHLRKIYYCRRQWPIMRKIKFISLFCILSLILEGIFGRGNSVQECQNVALILWHYVCIANIEIDWKCQILTFIHLAFVCTVLHLYSSIRISKICRIAFLKFSKLYSLFLLFVIILKI